MHDVTQELAELVDDIEATAERLFDNLTDREALQRAHSTALTRCLHLSDAIGRRMDLNVAERVISIQRHVGNLSGLAPIIGTTRSLSIRRIYKILGSIRLDLASMSA